MEDDIDYSEFNDVEIGYNQYVLENDLGKLVVRGNSRVFIPRDEEACSRFFSATHKMTWNDIEELAEKGNEQAIILLKEVRNKLRSYHYGRTNS